MTKEPDLTVAERIRRLMDHLGIEKAHFAGRSRDDYSGYATVNPERIASLSLVGLSGFDPQVLDIHASRLQIICGDTGEYVKDVQTVKETVPNVSLTTLPDYDMIGWTDVIADRTDEIGQVLLHFLAKHDATGVEPIDQPATLVGVTAGISYRIRGLGPPLILLPLTFAPSQWEPLIPLLAKHYCTIVLGGAHLGMMPALEARGGAAGYRRIVKNLLNEAQMLPGQSILDVGPGSGALDRWLVHDSNKNIQITAVDLNPYLLKEATYLARQEDLLDAISFREGDATALQFPDSTFDFSFSITVLEEGDADKMLAEMVRVTKPGGKVAAIVRAMDQPFIFNLNLSPSLMEKVINMPFGAVSEKGCADASLYSRFHQAGLTQVTNLPQLATFGHEDLAFVTWMSAFFLGALQAEEQEEVRKAMKQVESAGTFFISWPHHCAIGTVSS